MSKNIEAMKVYFQKVWTEENRDYIFEAFRPQATCDLAHGLDKDEGLTPEAFATFHGALLQLIKEVQITIDAYMEQGDWVSARCTMNAKSRMTEDDHPVQITGSVMVKMVDGIIIEAYNFWDFLHMFESLGLMPENTLAKCLSGQKIYN